MKYQLVINQENIFTQTTEEYHYQFKNEFDREDACWDLTHIKNPLISYGISQDDWILDDYKYFFWPMK